MSNLTTEISSYSSTLIRFCNFLQTISIHNAFNLLKQIPTIAVANIKTATAAIEYHDILGKYPLRSSVTDNKIIYGTPNITQVMIVPHNLLFLSHNHHFKWWFGLALIRTGYMLAPKGGYRKRCYWSAYKAVLLESSFLDSSACSLIYFFIASSVILPIVET